MSVDDGPQGAERARRGLTRAGRRLRAWNRSDAAVGAARRLRRALPGDQGFGDPLSTAGEGRVRALARAADRVLPEQEAASREMGFATLQVWQAMLERFGGGDGDTEVTLAFTDLVDFSTWALAAGDEQTVALLRAVSGAVEPAVLDAGGRVIKRMGDGLMAEFRSPERAVHGMRAAQRRLDEVEIDGYRPRMRAGLHVGRPRRIGDDRIGVDVNIAARMMEAAGGGQLVVSADVLDVLDPEWLAENEIGVRDHRRFFLHRPRGVPADLRMFLLD